VAVFRRAWFYLPTPLLHPVSLPMHRERDNRDDHGQQAPEVITSTRSGTSGQADPAPSALSLSNVVQMCDRNETKVELK